jgi:hypothetical protein
MLAACGGSGSSSGGGTNPGAGGGTSSGPSTPKSIGLQQADAAGLQSCPQSGDAASSSDKNVQGEWKFQQGQGATAGYIQLYADSSANCQPFISINPGIATGKLIGSVVVQYKDSATAIKAYGGGVFGVNKAMFANSGSAVGLGDNSVYSYQSTAGAAQWVNGSFVVGVLAHGFAESDLKTALSNINGRIH